MIPKIDTDIGISTYSTKFPRVSGKIKSSSDDFFVSEVLSKKILDTISENDGFSVYILQKNGIDTTHALRDVEKRFGLVLNALGLKDSTAVTNQYVQTKTKSKSLEKIEGKKYSLNRIGFSKKQISKQCFLYRDDFYKRRESVKRKKLLFFILYCFVWWRRK